MKYVKLFEQFGDENHWFKSEKHKPKESNYYLGSNITKMEDVKIYKCTVGGEIGSDRKCLLNDKIVSEPVYWTHIIPFTFGADDYTFKELKPIVIDRD